MGVFVEQEFSYRGYGSNTAVDVT